MVLLSCPTVTTATATDTAGAGATAAATTTATAAAAATTAILVVLQRPNKSYCVLEAVTPVEVHSTHRVLCGNPQNTLDQ